MSDHDGFWKTRDSLEHLLTLARARGVGPWALLGSALARAVASIPPAVTLPPIVGGRMSLNLCVAAVGLSGGGKGAADAVAAERFDFGLNPDVVPVGSGEGIARTFRPQGTKPDDLNPVTTAIFHAAEVDTLAALSGRQGATITGELRKLYSGEPLGFANAGRETRVVVEAHSYRACLIVGVQPARSDVLLGAADGGLPQRFVWLPVSDPDAPADRPVDPGIWKPDRPHWERAVGDHDALVVPDVAREAIRAHRLAVLREEPSVDPLDGHSLLTRLKVAAALMAIEGRTVIDSTDWSLAGYVMDVSNYTRERCRRALTEQSRRTNAARALAAAERDEITADHKHRRCRNAILRWIERAGDQPISRTQLTRSVKSDVRHCFDSAISELVAENRITAVRTPKGWAYSGPTADPGPTPSDLQKQTLDRRSRLDTTHNRNRERTRGKFQPSQQTIEQAG